MADSWMPGWTATVDGRPAPILRGNYAQRVIPLPEPGRHAIVMEYRPPGFVIGCAISIVSALAWMLIVLRRAFRRSRAPMDDRSALRGTHLSRVSRVAEPRTGLFEPAQRVRIPDVRHPICHDPGGTMIG